MQPSEQRDGKPDATYPEITTPSNDPDMPNHQAWQDANGAPTLDRRGNWLAFESQVQTTLSQQTRTLANPGGAANEYERLQVLVGDTPVSQRAYYDAAGNLVALDLYGDMNCDGVVNFADVDAFNLAITNPAAYAAAYPNCQIILGDVNGDGLVDYGDVDIFVALLSMQLPETRRFAYDEENRLAAVTDWNNNTLLELRYDALGRRVQTVDYTETRTPCGTAV